MPSPYIGFISWAGSKVSQALPLVARLERGGRSSSENSGVRSRTCRRQAYCHPHPLRCARHPCTASLPLRETQGKNFVGARPHRKIVSDQNFACDLPVESKVRQGSGRETRKPPERRLPPTDHCHHINLIN